MDTWYKMLLTALLIVAVMLITGRIFSTRPPKNVNTFFGIRTTMSMKNQDTWRFAHKTAGRLLWKWGWVSLPAVLLLMAFLWGRPEETVKTAGLIICCVLIVPFIAISVYTDHALHKTFREDGTRRESK